MASVKYPQVYRPDGTWYAFFMELRFAKEWVKKQPNAELWEITDRRPVSPS